MGLCKRQVAWRHLYFIVLRQTLLFIHTRVTLDLKQ
jgi:hypothetical protein